MTIPGPGDEEALAAAIAKLEINPRDGRRVRVRWRTDTGDLLVRLIVPSPDGDVRRWRRWGPLESRGNAVTAFRLCVEAVHRAAAASWDGWNVGDPPFIPFLNHEAVGDQKKG